MDSYIHLSIYFFFRKFIDKGLNLSNIITYYITTENQEVSSHEICKFSLIDAKKHAKNILLIKKSFKRGLKKLKIIFKIKLKKIKCI